MRRVEPRENFGDDTDQTSHDESSACHAPGEVTDLHRQIASLSRTIGDLTSTIRNKDAHLENVQRDNERLASELKRQQRCNRNLKQQLDDESFFYQREREHFCQETRSRRTRSQANGTTRLQQERGDFEKLRESLENENELLRREILEKSEVTYNLCIKFLRMRDSRDSLRQKLDRLLQEHLQVMAETMEKLDEAREELNIIVSEKFPEPLPISKAKFLQVVQRNSKLVYENARSKLHVQQLTQNIERLRMASQKTKTMSVDARTIERLTECARRRRSEEATKNFSNATNVRRPSPTSKSSSALVDSPIVDKAADPKVISSLRSKNRGKSTTENFQDSQRPLTTVFRAERIRSAPEIVQTTKFKQAQFFETPTNFTSHSEGSVEFRDAGTNT